MHLKRRRLYVDDYPLTRRACAPASGHDGRLQPVLDRADLAGRAISLGLAWFEPRIADRRFFLFVWAIGVEQGRNQCG